MLSKLINKPFNCISRAVDMLCLFLGDNYDFTSADGRTVKVAEFSLHLQTQWRFSKDNTILLASRDIYEPYSKDVAENWEYDIIGRPDCESSIFDVFAKTFAMKMQDAIVTECQLSKTNDITIGFSNGVVFEQFTPASQKCEEWRLIDYKNNLHTICYDENGTITCT